MSLAELCKNTAKKAKEKERCGLRQSAVEDDEDCKPKQRIGPHTPPLPSEPSSPRVTPEPSSTADFSKSLFQDDRDREYTPHHRHRYESSSRSASPVDSYRSHGQIRSYSAGSSRSHANATSTTSKNLVIPAYSAYISSRCATTTTRYRHDSLERERNQSVTGTRTVSPPPLPVKRRTPEKVPYYSDEKRERDRLRRKYREDYASSSSSKRARTSPAKQAYFIDDKREKDRLHRLLHNDDYVRHSPSRSNSPAMHSHLQSRHRSSGPELHHSDRYRRLSPLSMRRLQHRYRGASRSRSRSRERRLPVAQPPTQIITIPVAVPPDYPYAFTSWPPQWGTPFPINPLMSSSSMPSIRQPPYGIPPYNPNIFRPRQRYSPMRNFCPRGSIRGNIYSRGSMRGHFLPRNPQE